MSPDAIQFILLGLNVLVIIVLGLIGLVWKNEIGRIDSELQKIPALEKNLADTREMQNRETAELKADIISEIRGLEQRLATTYVTKEIFTLITQLKGKSDE